MFALEAIGEVVDGGLMALGDTFGLRIDPFLDLGSQIPCLLSSPLGLDGRKPADGEHTLVARLPAPVFEDKGAESGGGDADAEAGDAGAGSARSVGVAVYLRTLRRRPQVTNDGVGEEDHGSSVSSPYRQ